MDDMGEIFLWLGVKMDWFHTRLYLVSLDDYAKVAQSKKFLCFQMLSEKVTLKAVYHQKARTYLSLQPIYPVSSAVYSLCMVQSMSIA